MAINTIAMATKMSENVERAIIQKSAAGFLADNDLKAKFVGGKTVSIPQMTTDGLADYDRDTGFVRGAVSVTRKTYTLSMDRGKSFQIDAQDNDESGIADLAGEVIGNFTREQVIPELDAYVLSKLAKVASDNSHTVSIGTNSTLEADCYKMFNTALMNVQEAIGYSNDELVAFINGTFWTALNNSSAFTRQILTSDFKRGEVTTQVKSINGVTLIPVVKERMKSAYTFYDGVTDTSGTSGGVNQKAGGFVAASGAKDIGLILMQEHAASLVKKAEVKRVFQPSQNINADAWKFDFRIYYDLFVKDVNKNNIYAYISA